MNAEKRRLILSNAMLLLAAILWGGNFVFSKNAAAILGPFCFMSLRYFIGAMIILPFTLFLEKKKAPEQRAKYDKKSFLYMVKLAATFSIVQLWSSVFTQWGLAYTTAGKASFLCAIYIVFVPLFSFIIFKTKSSWNMWVGIVLAVFGFYNLCFTGDDLSINPGDLLVLLSTVFSAAHILLISKFVQKVNGMHLICLEFLFAGSYCMIFSLIIEHPTLSQIADCGVELFYASVFASGICYMLQVTAQKYTDPTIAALLMSLESVFGAIGSVIFLGDTFSTKELFGVVCVFAAVIIAQLRPKEKIVLKVVRKYPRGTSGEVDSISAEVAASVKRASAVMSERSDEAKMEEAESPTEANAEESI